MTALERLKTVVGDSGWISDPEKLQPHLEEWRRAVFGKSPLLLQPTTTAQVSRILQVCAESKTALVPQGGNTGMCAGAVPSAAGDQVILSLARMNNIRQLDASNFSMEVEAGCVLSDVQAAAAAADRHFAIRLGSEDSCQIGGNLSTNAGGLNVIRYGTAREQVLGLEVVMADGRVVNGLRSLRKDTAGYDLKQLFIGSEGTLGIITAAALKLHPSPGTTQAVLLALDSAEQAIALLAFVRNALGDVLEAFELISGTVLNLVTEAGSGFKPPFDDTPDWVVLMDAAADSQAVSVVLEEALASGLIRDAILAKNDTEASELWRMRHSISAAERRKGKALKHDISVPVSKLAEFLQKGEEVLAEVAPSNTLFVFGHVGDGNLHYNVVLDAALTSPAAVTHAIYDLVQEYAGSISAEHGIGSLKREYLATYRSPVELELMRSLKKTLDPDNILNPGKVI